MSLRQLADFIAEAQVLVSGQSLDTLLGDPVRLRAFERVMELIGECVKRLPPDLRDRHHDVPWRQIVGMWDVISHAYEDVSHEILWDALKLHLPALQARVDLILRDLG